jgi:peptide deformylase
VAGSGILGRALQHELDHLDGKLYIDYLGSLDELISTEHDEDEDEEGRPAAVRTAVG